MASDLAGRFATAFNPVGSNPVNSTLLYKQGTPNLFGDLLYKSQTPKQPTQDSDWESVIQGLDAEGQKQARLDRARALSESYGLRSSGLIPPYATPEELLEIRKQDMRAAQEIGKESLKEGFKYSMLANIPKSIAQAYSGIAATNLYGGQAITDAMSKTLAAYPRPQFATVNFQPQKYFG